MQIQLWQVVVIVRARSRRCTAGYRSGNIAQLGSDPLVIVLLLDCWKKGVGHKMAPKVYGINTIN